jgi:hypothetical protein
MATNNIILSCRTGVIDKISDYNLASPKEDRDLCAKNATGTCVNSINSNVKTDIEKLCIGKQ